MAFVLDDKKGDNSTVTSTPLSNGQGGVAPSNTPQQPPQNAPVSTNMSPQQQQGQTAQRPPQQPKTSSGSGMFTNIQKYVEKNKPKTDNMANKSMDAIKQAGIDAKNASNAAVDKFSTQAKSSGLHDTSTKVGQLEAYTRDQAGYNNTTNQSSENQQPTEPQMSVNDQLKEYENSVRYDYDTQNLGDSGATGYGTWENYLETVHPNYEQRRQEIMASGNNTQTENNTQQTVNNNTDSNQYPMIDEKQFADIINAKYRGPKSLSELGNVYRELADQARESAMTGELSQNRQGRKQLLKNIFTKNDNEYGSGLAGLDEYLLGKAGNKPGDVLEQMRTQGKLIGSQQDILRDASRSATDIASDVETSIADTRDQARQKFSEIAGNRQTEIDNRVNDVIENWDTLPDFFREIFSNPDGTVNLSAVEAGILGVQGGEGYYNLKGDDLFANKGEEGYIDPVSGKLITKQESENLQRLKALSDMALTQKDLFNIKEDYSNTDQAGSQSALDALNLERVRNKMAEAEEGFRKFADEDLSIVGKGEHGYKTGLFKTGKRKYAKKSYGGSKKYDLKEALGDKYDWDSDVIDEQTGNADILKDIGNYYQNPENYQDTEGYGDNLNMGSGSEMYDQGFFESMGYNSLAPLEEAGKFFSETINNPFEGFYQIGENLEGIPIVGDMVKALGELGGGGEKRKAERYAMEKAQKDFKSKYKNTMDKRIEQSNIDNRIGIADDAETRARFEKLKELMKNTDLSNT